MDLHGGRKGEQRFFLGNMGLLRSQKRRIFRLTHSAVEKEKREKTIVDLTRGEAGGEAHKYPPTTPRLKNGITTLTILDERGREGGGGLDEDHKMKKGRETKLHSQSGEKGARGLPGEKRRANS